MLHSVIHMCRCKIIFMHDVSSWTTQYHIPEHHNLTTDITLPFNLNPFWSKYFLRAAVSDTCNYILVQKKKTNKQTKTKTNKKKTYFNCTNQLANVCMVVHMCVSTTIVFFFLYLSSLSSMFQHILPWPSPYYIKFNVKHSCLLMRCIVLGWYTSLCQLFKFKFKFI
jgi:uncharacterized membrane protein